MTLTDPYRVVSAVVAALRLEVSGNNRSGVDGGPNQPDCTAICIPIRRVRRGL